MKSKLESYPQAREAMGKVRERQEQAKESAQIATRAASDYVEENPWKAIAIVAICALALGFLLRGHNE